MDEESNFREENEREREREREREEWHLIRVDVGVVLPIEWVEFEIFDASLCVVTTPRESQ
jgi:hypothetical protein